MPVAACHEPPLADEQTGCAPATEKEGRSVRSSPSPPWPRHRPAGSRGASPPTSVLGQDAYPDERPEAAALLHSLARNHPLVDGNKRLAWLATYVSCAKNGVELDRRRCRVQPGLGSRPTDADVRLGGLRPRSVRSRLIDFGTCGSMTARCWSSDVERSVRFYTGALGLTEVPRPPTFDTPGAWLQVGDQQIHLVGEAESGRAREMNPPCGPGRDRDRLQRPTSRCSSTTSMPPSSGPRAWRRAGRRGLRARGWCAAHVVTDPDGHVIELMETGVQVTGEEPRLVAPRRTG